MGKGNWGGAKGSESRGNIVVGKGYSGVRVGISKIGRVARGYSGRVSVFYQASCKVKGGRVKYPVVSVVLGNQR